MGFINVFVASDAHISVENRQLVLSGEKQMRFPLEDINSVVIENRNTQLTTCAISEIAAAGGVLYVCDDKHLPTTVVLPSSTHYRKLKAVRAQINASKPLVKQLWQKIVKAKIVNQAECLRLCGKPEYEKVFALSKRVLSGDSENREAEAVAVYFKALFGKDFVRAAENNINFTLNYGYAVMRGLVARTIATHGFEPSLGIFHCNELNPFNLADDLMEPLRPIVDLFAFAHSPEYASESLYKKEICNLMNCDVNSGGERHGVVNAVERLVSSFGHSLYAEEAEIIPPYLLPLTIHKYE